jgi:hypothetical protein
MSDSTRSSWQNPEVRRKRSRGISEALKELHKDPEFRRQHSERIKKAWAEGAFDDSGVFSEETKRKRIESRKRFYESHPEALREIAQRTKERWKPGGDLRSSEMRRKRSKGARAAWARGAYDDCFGSPTSIELEVMTALDVREVGHVSQYRPKGCHWVYDEFVPPRTLVEVQGSYWHTLSDMQERDMEKARWAHENGFFLIAIWDFHLEEYGADFLVENWILPLVGTGTSPEEKIYGRT